MRWNKWYSPWATSKVLLVLCVLSSTFVASARLVSRNKTQERAWATAFLTNGSIVHLKIEIAASNIEALSRAPHKYVTATLREGNVTYQDVGIHLKGSAGSFRPINGDKPGFTLNFNTFESNTNFHGLKKFHLNNSVQDPTHLSDWLSNGLFRDAGVPAPYCAHALVELNGRKLGLFVLMESNDRDFLSRYFTNTQGNVYGQPGHGDVASDLERTAGKGPLDRADLKALTAACREPDPAKRWERLQKTLDIDRFLSFMAMEVFLCDWDGYTAAQHNYRVYQDLDTGRMVFLPHDKDQVLGNPGQPYMPGSGSVVCQAILNLPQGRQLYRERCGYLFTNVFQAPVLTKRVDDLVAKLLPTLQAYNPNFARDFVNHANGLKARIVARAQGLGRQFHVPPKPTVAAAQAPKPPAPTRPAASPAPNPQNKSVTTSILKAQWEPVQAQNSSKLEKLQLENKPVLYIKSEQANCIGAWRANVDLRPGLYRFSGRAKSRGLAALATQYGSGGGLRISGANRKNQLAGDRDWTTLEEDFNVTTEGPTRLFCELRADKGEIWFDLQSLKLERVK